MKAIKLICHILAFVLLFSCKEKDVLADLEADNLKLSQLLTEVQTYAQNRACAGDDCKVMEIGEQSCGGPSGHLIYSLSKVDEKVLIEKVKTYTDFQRKMSIKYKGKRDEPCALLLVPTVDCVNGLCTAK
ncbi:hypothetical protein VB776_18485 [Arcicella sp. DC2W]|uniref:Lipoprotein n=1 Tax=Arcicella gelida TaxID=2984195 RepID=A0ABU5S9N2_9BACT|nr:hypothetical protein [Arcicella sp. DC2W]MEA5404928.1 hypothetical protein [Arcicella sp. DC2W]